MDTDSHGSRLTAVAVADVANQIKAEPTSHGVRLKRQRREQHQSDSKSLPTADRKKHANAAGWL
jgi:hypothetical protein